MNYQKCMSIRCDFCKVKSKCIKEEESMSKKDNLKVIKEYEEALELSKPINQKLEKELKNIIRNGENLSDYELWINKKCEVMIKTDYIIDRKIKDFEKEKIFIPPYNKKELVYVLVKRNREKI